MYPLHLENEFGRFLLIQKKRKDNGKWITKGRIPIESGKEFVRALNNVLIAKDTIFCT